MHQSKITIDHRIIRALDEYYSLGGVRKREGLDYVTLSCVDERHRDLVINSKHYFILWNIILDDAADTHRNTGLANILLDIYFTQKSLTEVDDRYKSWIKFHIKLWDEFNNMIQDLPQIKIHEDLLKYDIRQFLNCIYYSILIARFPHLTNGKEHELYISHNMNLVIFSTIDLIGSPQFDVKDLSILRKAVWEGQYMARIDNDLVTWEREALEGDFSSSIFALALERGIINHDSLSKGLNESHYKEIVQKIIRSNILLELNKEWHLRKDIIVQLIPMANSVDLNSYLKGLLKLHRLYQKSKEIV